MFGPAASAEVREMIEARGIELDTATMSIRRAGNGADSWRRADGRWSVVALPTMEGPHSRPSDRRARVHPDRRSRPSQRGSTTSTPPGTAPTSRSSRAGSRPSRPTRRRPKSPIGSAPRRTGAVSTGASGQAARPARPRYTCGPTSREAAARGYPPSTASGGRPYKVSGRYLTPWLYHGDEAREDPSPPDARSMSRSRCPRSGTRSRWRSILTRQSGPSARGQHGLAIHIVRDHALGLTRRYTVRSRRSKSKEPTPASSAAATTTPRRPAGRCRPRSRCRSSGTRSRIGSSPDRCRAGRRGPRCTSPPAARRPSR